MLLIPAQGTFESLVLPNTEHANVLSINTYEDSDSQIRIITTTSDRHLHMYGNTPKSSQSYEIERFATCTTTSDSPILSSAPIYTWKEKDGTTIKNEKGIPNMMLITSMTGSISLVRLPEGKVLASRKDHSKYCIKVATSKNAVWMATAGWDKSIYIYAAPTGPKLGTPIAKAVLESNPENIIFVAHPLTGEDILLVSRRDSTYLSFYRLPEIAPPGEEITDPAVLTLMGRQNLTPHSNSWNLFTPSHFALSPIHNDIIAIATSTTPHMKVIIARLLFPTSTVTTPSPLDNPNEARQALALQNKEDAAILIQTNALAPQTSYSTPMLAWRPDGSGVWVNGDDGAIRGIEARTGKVVVTLTGGHDPAVKIRCLWAGRGEDGQEWLCSGGFDKKAILWYPQSATVS